MQMREQPSFDLTPYLNMGDPDAFKTVFLHFYPLLCSFAHNIVHDSSDAEDIIEELFTNLWKKHPSFESENHLKAFLYRSAKNACLNSIKLSARSGMRNSLYADENGYAEEAYINEIIRAEILRDVYAAIESLSPQCSKIITMSYVEGKSNQEIADELNLSLQTVKNQKGKGLALLRQRLPEDKFGLLMLLPYLEVFRLLCKH